MYTVGDFKVGVSVGVYCTKCTLNTGVNTNFEITQCTMYNRSEVCCLWLEAVVRIEEQAMYSAVNLEKFCAD
jgi:hypothetical protein